MSSILDNRIPVVVNVDATTGNISWDKRLVDHNVDTFYRGKTVTNNEFNDLFLRHAYESDYLADTLEQLLGGGKIKAAVSGAFRSEFNLKPSYVKTFSTEDWGDADAEGYYHITIPASEHGFEPGEGSTALETMNIDTEMYVLSNGIFYEVPQVNTASDNTVTIYTDDNTVPGFVVIRFNDKSYTLQEATIEAAQVVGLADVAYNGQYSSLTGRAAIEDRIAANENTLESIISDTPGVNPFVHNADYATEADTAVHLAGENATINNIPVSNIFEEGSRVVKDATNAIYAQYASSDVSKGSIENRLTTLSNNIESYRVHSLKFTDLEQAITFIIEHNIQYFDLKFKSTATRDGKTFLLNYNNNSGTVSWERFTMTDPYPLLSYSTVYRFWCTTNTPNATTKRFISSTDISILNVGIVKTNNYIIIHGTQEDLQAEYTRVRHYVTHTIVYAADLDYITVYYFE